MKNKNIIEKFSKITYHEESGILYPDAEISAKPHYSIGKYGNLRRAFLKEHRKGTYTSLLTEDHLNVHLHEVDVQSRKLLDSMLPQLTKERGVDESLKSADPMKWVREMNAIKSEIEEIIFSEIIYQ